MDSSNQSNTGLLKFRSATSSLFDYGVLVDNKTTTNSDSERLFSRFCDESESQVENSFRDFDDKSTVAINQRKFGPGLLPPHYPRQNLSSNENGDFASAMENHHSQVKTSLLRQNSSPAGLFSHIPNGYGDLSPSANRLKTQLSFSPRLPSSLGMLSRISEDANESLVASPLEEEKLGAGNNGDTNSRFYGSGYAYGSWNDSFDFTENFGGQRRDQESNRKPCSGIVQNEEIGNRIQMLSHHLSLPKSSVEIEKYLHFQDSVPCKVRAKRGCATHPRSIAERVRRTRISERMRKLQELVPNMDKQTNTADMLDLAVDYIKDLQKQYKSLSDKRVNCKCILTQKPVPNQVV